MKAYKHPRTIHQSDYSPISNEGLQTSANKTSIRLWDHHLNLFWLEINNRQSSITLIPLHTRNKSGWSETDLSPLDSREDTGWALGQDRNILTL